MVRPSGKLHESEINILSFTQNQNEINGAHGKIQISGLTEPQIKRIIKKLKLLFEPNELAPFYRNFNLKQQDKFLECQW